MGCFLDGTFNLEGKCALVTGAASGIGKRCAEILSKVGAKIIEVDIEGEESIDIGDKTSVAKLFNDLEKRGDKIDVCVNAAGIGFKTPVFDDEDKDEEFEKVMQVNVMGTWYMIKAVASHMRKHSIAGSIVNIASTAGDVMVCDSLSSYCASKAAVINMTRSLVKELSRANIRINCISPGMFHTNLTKDLVANKEVREQIEKMTPVNFIAEPTDIDALILLLASNKASRYITGEVITIDGGRSWANG